MRFNSIKFPIIEIALALILLITRGHHFASIEYLPSASWAVFFISGFYIRKTRFFVLLLLEAALLDYVAITFNNVSSFCISPAYGFLVFAYGSLWWGGKLFRRYYQSYGQRSWQSLALLTVIAISSAAIAEMISSGSFYWLSGRFPDPTLSTFIPRFALYFPKSLSAMALYLFLAVITHAIFVWGHSNTEHNRNVSLRN